MRALPEMRLTADRLVEVRDRTTGAFRFATIFDFDPDRPIGGLSEEKVKAMSERRIKLDDTGMLVQLPEG